MTYPITQARLDALSPAARQLANAALELGLWRLEEEESTPAQTAAGA